jgi:hypothetical protein
VRRLLVLVRGLPADSRLSTAIRGGPEFTGWDLHAYLLAGIFDGVQANTHAVVQTNSRRRVKPPAPLSRPAGAHARRRRVVRVAELPGARPTAAP